MSTNTANNDYDVVVVGAGMFGSSAAKHLRKLTAADGSGSGNSSQRIAVIGPKTNTSELCRGQHFDEARICRRVETLAPWAFLNNDGCLSYRETEKESGIDFFTPCGVVWIATKSDKAAVVACMDALIAKVPDRARLPFSFYNTSNGDTAAAPKEGENFLAVIRSGAEAEGYFNNGISVAQFAKSNKCDSKSSAVNVKPADPSPSSLYPPAGIADDGNTADSNRNEQNVNSNGTEPEQADGEGEGDETYFIVEKGPESAGTVHPTRYVEAQLKIAAQTGAPEGFAHLDEIVVSITKKESNSNANSSNRKGNDSARGAGYVLTTDQGRVYTAAKVIVSAAAFSVYHDLIPADAQRLVRPIAEHVVLLRVDPPGAAADSDEVVAVCGDNTTNGNTKNRSNNNHDNAPHPDHVAMSEQLPAVIRTSGGFHEQFYCLPPRYYSSEDKQGWFVKMGSTNAHEDIPATNKPAGNTAALSNSSNESSNNDDEVNAVDAATATPARHERCDVSTLKGALDWYDGRVPVPHGETRQLASMLATVYPNWTVYQDAGDVEEPANNNHDSHNAKPLRVKRDAAGNALANSFVVRCIWDMTKTGGPIIDSIATTTTTTKTATVHGGGEEERPTSSNDDDFFVTLGGNGRGAKGCDPIGRLAALKTLRGSGAAMPVDWSHYNGLYTAASEL